MAKRNSRPKGPSIGVGKAAISVQHGLTASAIRLSHGDATELNAVFAEAIREFAPVAVAELQILKQLTIVSGKLLRLWHDEQDETHRRSLRQQASRLERLRARHFRPAPLGTAENVFPQNEPKKYHTQEGAIIP